ncbi:MAG: hypothetical protein K7J46_06910 [Bryobacter sp.]|jgi:hypothetical protein|nr:hypothetical protein [Bryobacter sp. CoA8 C33]
MNSLVRFLALLLGLLTLLPAQAPSSLNWASYLRGGNSDTAVKVLVEPFGDIWIGGHSAGKYEAYGPNEPFQLNNAGRTDIFLLKLRVNPDGSATTLFFTWLGGADIEELTDMKFDAAGRVVLTGLTNSNNFPMAGSPFQNIIGGDFDSFVSIIDPNQGGAPSLFYSTYYGGVEREFARALAIGANGNIAVVGNTAAEKIPGAENGAQPVRRGNTDAFVFCFNPSSTTLIYASFLGGNGNDTASSVVIDSTNRIWFAGTSSSDDFPLTENALQLSSTGFADGYVAAVDPARRGLDSFLFGTLIGGSGSDEARALALDRRGNLWVGGITFSSDFPTTARAMQGALGGGTDAFLLQFDPRLRGKDALLYSTYLGGSGFEFLYDMKLIDDSRVALAGYSMSGQLPTTANAVRRNPASPFADGMVAVVNSANIASEGLEYLSYFGGSATDVVNSVAFDPANPRLLYLVGYTTSSDLPTSDNSSRANPAPAPNAFGARIIR